MLRWISIFGGLLIMMGQHDRSEALFYYFRLEDQVPETHLLRTGPDRGRESILRSHGHAKPNRRDAGISAKGGVTTRDPTMAERMPALFIGHGNPMNALLVNSYTQRWAAIGATLPKPKAILSVSAHWYIEDAAVTVSTAPTTMEGPNVRQSFDGFRLSVCDEGWKIDLLATKPVETNVGFFDDAPDHTRSFWGVYAVHSVPFLSKATADIYYLGLDRKHAHFDQGTEREIRHSIGARISRPIGGMDYNFEALYQWGAFGPGHISAWTVASDTGYTLKDIAWKPRLSLKEDVASGDKDPNNPDLQSFNPLFPKGSYFGEDSLIGPVNFVDLHPTIELHISRAITLIPTTLFFWRQSTKDGLYGPAVNLERSGKSSQARYVGTSPQLELDWAVNRHLGATVYYSHFFAGRFLRESGPGKDVDFFTTWVTYKF